MKTILVTGGAGFIGSCFVRQILEQPSLQVVNLDQLTYAGNLDSLAPVTNHPHHHFVHGDIRDTALTTHILRKYEPVAIVHLAAETHVDRSIRAPTAFVDTNVTGTFRLLEATRRYWSQLPSRARHQFRFLHISTDEVYGSLGPTGRFTETSRYMPNSPYSASKAAADHFVRAYGQTYRLPIMMTNCSNNYGPYQFPEKLVPLMILNAVAGKPLPIYGDGSNIRDWVHVEDHCRALQMVLSRGQPGETYHVGGNSERTNLEVVQTICDAVDRWLNQPDSASCRRQIQFVADRPGHDFRYAMDIRKIQSELGWQPQVEFESGIQATVDWYLTQARWVERVLSGKYRQLPTDDQMVSSDQIDKEHEHGI